MWVHVSQLRFFQPVVVYADVSDQVFMLMFMVASSCDLGCAGNIGDGKRGPHDAHVFGDVRILHGDTINERFVGDVWLPSCQTHKREPLPLPKPTNKKERRKAV